MSNVALAAAALVPAVFSAPVGSKAKLFDFAIPAQKSGQDGYAVLENFLVADYTEVDPFQALMLAMGRPQKITDAIKAAGIDPMQVAFEVLGASDPADLRAFVEAQDGNSAPEGVWVAAWGDDNADNGEGLNTDEFVFVRVL